MQDWFGSRYVIVSFTILLIKTSINFQEIDLATGTLSTIQSGSRKLLAKANPVHALQVHAGQIYAATSTLDGAVVKVSIRLLIC